VLKALGAYTRAVRWLAIVLLPVLVGAVPANQAFDSLLRLRGDRAQVRYSAGALDRAANVQRRFEALTALYEKAAGRLVRGGEVRLAVVVAAPEDWSSAGGTYPYGLPEIVEAGLLVPAWGTEDTVRRWRDLTGLEAPLPAGDPVRGTREEAASLAFADLVAQIEGARGLVRSSAARFSAPWLRELCAQLVALAAFERYEAPRKPEVVTFFAALAMRQSSTLLAAPGGFSRQTEIGSLPLAARLAAGARYFAMADAVAKGKALPVAEWLLGLARRPEGVTEQDALRRWPQLSTALAALDAGLRP
jgi:hypothetical protein